MPAPLFIRAAWARTRQVVITEWRHLARVNASERPFEMPVAAAAATGLPIFIGAAFGELGYGLVASIGGLVFLYLPPTRLAHRMAWLMACAFALAGCYALGVLSHLYAPLMVPLLTVIAILATMVCRFYAVPPPGSLFFVMAAAIGAYTPSHGATALAHVGLLVMGSLLAVAVAFVYSLYMLRGAAQGLAPPQAPAPEFEFVIMESIVIGCFVGLSLALAQALQLPRPYWVPVSCMAVIQGASLRAAWIRQLHRITGTAAGLALFLALVALPLDAWRIAWLITALIFVIETLVVRHYALAVVFITPMTILLAEASQLPTGSPMLLMQARLIDTAVGCLVGFVGAACLHSPRFRAVAGALLRGRRPG